jgi:protein gp37
MGETTAIAWTDHTFNPWWGCERVSPGCLNCYAETFAKRTGHDVWGKRSERRFFGDKHWAEPLKWNAQAEAEGRRHRVFCASMADVFEDRPDLIAQRCRLVALIENTSFLEWQLLTKRPENVQRLTDTWNTIGWPPNVWLGTTVEDQERAVERIPVLLSIPAAVRFLSCEPLLSEVDLDPLYPGTVHGPDWLGEIDWVICGGESGPKHRPLDVDHARSLRDQCVGAGVPFFFKQVGGRTPKAGGDLLDDVEWKQFPKAMEIA